MQAKKHNLEGFVGDFGKLLNRFIKHKRSLGYKYVAAAESLKRFSKFTMNYKIKSYILTKTIVDAWIAKRPGECDITQEKRIDIIKQFIKFLNDLGYKASVPILKAKSNRNLYVPHIFTPEQLGRFFAECAGVKKYSYSNRHLLLPAIYRLLYGCGLRISEAVALKLKDVDLKHGIITIHGSKFNKDRLIPMSPSLTKYLESYFLKVHTVSSSGDYFFLNKDKTTITSDTVYRNFRKILWKSGISHGGKGRGPRLHDFRHTFSVHSLNQMVCQKVELYCALRFLATYLGHASIKITERYVRLTAETYPEILTKINRTCAYIFPEVNVI